MRESMDALLTVDEVAVWLRVEPATVRRWACEGSGPAHVKVGTFVRYRRAAVEAWLDERTVEQARRAPRRYRNRIAVAQEQCS